MMVILVVHGILRTVPKGCQKRLEELEMEEKLRPYRLNLLVLVSAFTLVGLNQVLPEQVTHLKKILWNLIERRVPSPTQQNTLFATDFPQTH